MNSPAHDRSVFLGPSPPMHHLTDYRPPQKGGVCHRPKVRVASALLAILLCLPTTGLAQVKAQKRVLVLFDAAREFSNSEYLGQSIDSVIGQPLNKDIIVYREYMDITRISQPDYDQLLASFYQKKYANEPPDVIIAVRGRALDFLLKYGDVLFPDVPIVSMGMDMRQVLARKLPSRVTGVALRVAYKPTLSFALTLKPETKHVAIIIGASQSDRALEALVQDEFSRIQSPPEFIYLTGLTLDDLLKRVANLPPDSVLIFVSFAKDASGHSYHPNESLFYIAQAANAPTFIASDDVANRGAVGGDLVFFGGLGKAAAQLALRILGGKQPAEIPFTEYSTRVKSVDASQLDRWKIPTNNIPAGTAYSFRNPTAWERYRWQIIVGVTLIVSQSVLIAVILIHRQRRQAVERALTRSEAARHSAVLEERNRLARDIHDSLAQGFAAVIIQLGAAKKAFAHSSAADAHQHIENAEEMARESLGEARRSIKALRPRELERGDLPAVLAELARKMAAGTTTRVDFTVNGEPKLLNQLMEENLLRILHEVLANALKHSGASTITATLSFTGDFVQLDVVDDGIGFDPGQDHDGFGLVSIRERVDQMDGRLKIVTAIKGGTSLSVILPVPIAAPTGIL
jgi:signal transduction histidine kinase